MNRETSTSVSPLVGRLCVLAAALLWSMSGMFVRQLDLPATTISLYRTLFAGLVILSVFLVRRGKPTFRPAMIGMILAFTLMSYGFVLSMTYTTAANAIFLQYTAPLWMTLGSVFLFRESADRRQIVALVGSLVGVAVILVGNRALASGEQLGMALGLASGFFYAAVALFLRHLKRLDPFWLTALNHLGAAGSLLIGQAVLISLGQASAADLAFPPEGSKRALLFLFGFLQMGLPYVLFGIGLRHISAQEAGIICLVEPILNPVWTYYASGEIPTTATLAGGTILLLALMGRYVPFPRKDLRQPTT